MAFPDELRIAFPSWGPDWDKAVEQGVDVALLLENLELTPTERLQQLESLHEQMLLLRQATLKKPS